MAGAGRIEVGGDAVESFAALARDLRRAGATELQKEVGKGLSRVSRKAKPAVLAESQKTLPKGGGKGRRGRRMVATGESITNAVSGREHVVRRTQLGGTYRKESVNDRVQAAAFTTRSSVIGRISAVRITARTKAGKKIDLQSLDAGELRHKTFGRGVGPGGKSLWQSQRVRPGFFSRPLERLAPDLLEELGKAVDVIEKTISGG